VNDSLNILIVDDDDGDRKQVKRILRQAGLAEECVEVECVDDALRACEHTAFDCVILDYQMAGRSGLDGLQSLREKHPFLPIIMSTGEGDESVAVESMRRGACDYIPKSKIDAASMLRMFESGQRWAERQRDSVEAYTQLKRLGLYDSLTNLANRTLFADRLDRLVLVGGRGGEVFSVLMMDLNLFKQVNDTMGHESGDEVLRQVAGRLLKVTRKSDTVARLGGDEFACLLPQVKSAEDAVLVAEKIAESVRLPMLVEGRVVSIDISIGIAQFPWHGLDGKALLDHADHAMYQAKQARSRDDLRSIEVEERAQR
jgi:diguanylate cyclase (GGDEF)-like protein